MKNNKEMKEMKEMKEEEEEEEEEEESDIEEKESEVESDDSEVESEDEILENPNIPQEQGSDIEEEEEEDDYLQKLEHHLDTSLLESVHPEIHSCNYDEMITLSRVTRENGRIVDPLHQTLPFLTKYEKARIIGARAEQLDSGGQAFVAVEPHIINGRTIAIMEFEQKKIPFILARPLPNGSIEYWDIRDLEIIME